MVLLHRLEIRVLHGITGSDSLGMIIPKHFAEHVQGFLTHEVLVLAVDKLVPRFLGVLPEDVIVVGIQGYIVLVDVSKELISAKHFSYLHKLIVVVLALEEGLLLEYHPREHASQGPYVKRIVIGL